MILTEGITGPIHAIGAPLATFSTGLLLLGETTTACSTAVACTPMIAATGPAIVIDGVAGNSLRIIQFPISPAISGENNAA